MWTSPPPMRLLRARRAAALAVAALLALSGPACGGDDVETSTPTTTSPATTKAGGATASTSGSSTATTEGATTEGATTEGATTPSSSEPPSPSSTEATGASTVPGGDATVLSASEAASQLQALLERYRSGLAQIRAADVVDEGSLRLLTTAFTAERASSVLEGLDRLGGASVIRGDGPALEVTDLQLPEATATCASGTAVVSGAAELFTTPIDVRPPHYFRLVPAPEGASGPSWRIDFFTFSTDGLPLEDARCA